MQCRVEVDVWHLDCLETFRCSFEWLHPSPDDSTLQRHLDEWESSSTLVMCPLGTETLQMLCLGWQMETYCFLICWFGVLFTVWAGLSKNLVQGAKIKRVWKGFVNFICYKSSFFQTAEYSLQILFCRSPSLQISTKERVWYVGMSSSCCKMITCWVLKYSCVNQNFLKLDDIRQTTSGLTSGLIWSHVCPPCSPSLQQPPSK